MKITGVPRPIEKVALTSYADSPFADVIALVEIPKRFDVPAMKLYDGMADPIEHVVQYKQRMIIIPIPSRCAKLVCARNFVDYIRSFSSLVH